MQCSGVPRAKPVTLGGHRGARPGEGAVTQRRRPGTLHSLTWPSARPRDPSRELPGAQEGRAQLQGSGQALAVSSCPCLDAGGDSGGHSPGHGRQASPTQWGKQPSCPHPGCLHPVCTGRPRRGKPRGWGPRGGHEGGGHAGAGTSSTQTPEQLATKPSCSSWPGRRRVPRGHAEAGVGLSTAERPPCAAAFGRGQAQGAGRGSFRPARPRISSERATGLGVLHGLCSLLCRCQGQTRPVSRCTPLLKCGGRRGGVPGACWGLAVWTGRWTGHPAADSPSVTLTGPQSGCVQGSSGAPESPKVGAQEGGERPLGKPRQPVLSHLPSSTVRAGLRLL